LEVMLDLSQLDLWNAGQPPWGWAPPLAIISAR